MVELFANSGDPDQMPHSAASDLGLHYLPNILHTSCKNLCWSALFKYFFLFFPENKV